MKRRVRLKGKRQVAQQHQLSKITHSGKMSDVRKLLAGGSSGRGSYITGLEHSGLGCRSIPIPIPADGFPLAVPISPRLADASDFLLRKGKKRSEDESSKYNGERRAGDIT